MKGNRCNPPLSPALRWAIPVLGALLLAAAASPVPAAQESRRIVSIADIHGAFDNFTAILQEVGLVDEELRWSGGDTIFVQTGDIFDRGPDVRRSMDLLMRLQQEAPEDGGEVIVVFGNHEAMNVASYWRDTTPADTAAFVDDSSEERRDRAYEEWTEMRTALAESLGHAEPRFDREAWDEAHPLGFVERMDALGPDGVYGRWLRQLPTAVRIDNLLFMHAGLNPEYAELSVDEINERVTGEVQRFDATKQAMVDAGLITPYADFVEMIKAADDKLVSMLRKFEETGMRPEAEGQELARQLDWVLGYADWQLLTREGLLWFRGLAQWPEAQHATEVADLLDEQDVDHIIVGHTVQADGRIRTRFDGGVLLTDTGMLTSVYHGQPSALEIEDGTFTAHYIGDSEVLLPRPVVSATRPRVGVRFVTVASGRPQGLPPTGRQSPVWMGPDGEPLPFASADQVLDFLRTADVVSMEEVGSGKTEPRRVELQRDGVRARGIFHTVDLYREEARIGDRFHAVFRDSWRSQVAAYRIARLIGLDNVAPTVARTIGEETGSLQLWLENHGLRTNLERVRAREYPTDVEAWLRQEWAMHVFDALIFNDDRHADNVLVDDTWKLWMIDHTRAFQTSPEIRDPELLNRIDMRMLDALRDLGRDTVIEAIGELLDAAQVNALMRRRDAILDHFGRLIDIEGEETVVYGKGGSQRAAIGDRAA